MASRFVNEVLEDNQNHQEGDVDFHEEQEEYDPSFDATAFVDCSYGILS